MERSSKVSASVMRIGTLRGRASASKRSALHSLNTGPRGPTRGPMTCGTVKGYSFGQVLGGLMRPMPPIHTKRRRHNRTEIDYNKIAGSLSTES
jgi:hypothetical protein